MYTKRLDRTHPGCVVVMVDQSGSMAEAVGDGSGLSKAETMAHAINSLLYELVIRCVKNPAEGPRHYYDIALIGYGASATPAWAGPLAGRGLVSIGEVANSPVRVTERVPPGSSTADTLSGPVRSPEWLDPKADGVTSMCGGFDMAGRLVAEWIRAHPDSFPPIVVNISDGAATDGDPVPWGERIRQLATRDGNVLLFNLNLSAMGGQPMMFPNSDEALQTDYAKALFAMSSPLPPYMAEMAASQGIGVLTGARGFVFNAGMNALVRFLQIGTATVAAPI